MIPHDWKTSAPGTWILTPALHWAQDWLTPGPAWMSMSGAKQGQEMLIWAHSPTTRAKNTNCHMSNGSHQLLRIFNFVCAGIIWEFLKMKVWEDWRDEGRCVALNEINSFNSLVWCLNLARLGKHSYNFERENIMDYIRDRGEGK